MVIENILMKRIFLIIISIGLISSCEYKVDPMPIHYIIEKDLIRKGYIVQSNGTPSDHAIFIKRMFDAEGNIVDSHCDEREITVHYSFKVRGVSHSGFAVIERCHFLLNNVKVLENE